MHRLGFENTRARYYGIPELKLYQDARPRGTRLISTRLSLCLYFIINGIIVTRSELHYSWPSVQQPPRNRANTRREHRIPWQEWFPRSSNKYREFW